jgi:superfamily I DNA and/or RNA helicase
VYRTYCSQNEGQLKRQFDAVIIDEASMLMLPLSFYAAGLAKERVIVAGDFRQLPPIVLSDEPIAKEWLKQDPFFKSEIPKKIQVEMPHLAQLYEQFRMRRQICEVVRELSYDRLDTVREKRPDSMPLGVSPLLYLDTGSLQPWAAMRLGSYSRYNLTHALLIRKLVVHLNTTGYLKVGRAGVIAPYAAQVEMVEALFGRRGY